MGEFIRAIQSAGSAADEAIQRIRVFARTQIRGMAHLATSGARRDCLHTIAACVDKRIGELSDMIHAGSIFPFCRLRLAECSPPQTPGDTPLRVGVYPLAANPLHWGHLLVGLSALVAMRLDKVIFVVAGQDPRKPSMPPPEIRHRLARHVIETFEPFLAYSPIALGTDFDGETNLGRLFTLNAGLPMHAFYIAGADHYRRRNDRGEPDTVEKLERVALETAHCSGSQQTVAAVFLERPDQRARLDPVDTFLDVRILPAMPFICSSSAARQTLCGEESSEGLTCLPYETLAEIRSLGLYGGMACRDGSRQ